jgi:hypothetical protein
MTNTRSLRWVALAGIAVGVLVPMGTAGAGAYDQFKQRPWNCGYYPPERWDKNPSDMVVSKCAVEKIKAKCEALLYEGYKCEDGAPKQNLITKAEACRNSSETALGLLSRLKAVESARKAIKKPCIQGKISDGPVTFGSGSEDAAPVKTAKTAQKVKGSQTAKTSPKVLPRKASKSRED